MRNLRFDTERLICRPLTANRVPGGFAAVVSSDEQIRRFFEFESVSKFFDSLVSYECFPVAAFLNDGDNSAFVGYINGFVRCPGELLVEYFIVEKYRRCGYASELLNAYMAECAKLKFHTFKFDVEDGNSSSAEMLEGLGATRCVSEDFTDETDHGKRVFFVYQLKR